MLGPLLYQKKVANVFHSHLNWIVCETVFKSSLEILQTAWKIDVVLQLWRLVLAVVSLAILETPRCSDLEMILDICYTFNGNSRYTLQSF